MTIDTLAYVKSLEAAGVDPGAAEAHAEALTHHIFPDLATKDDIKAEFDALRAEMHRQLVDINGRFAGIEGRLTNLPTAIQLLFMQAALILAILVGAYGLLKLAGPLGDAGDQTP